MPQHTLKLGARGSLLSRLQSESVARALEAAHPGLRVELITITTSGDRIQDRPLHEFGGKGLFTKELEQSLLNHDIDFAVHSCKDLPVTMPLVDVADLVIAAVPPREDPRDLLISPRGSLLRELPANAKLGTGSLRRQAQALALRPDLRIEPIRGNVDTRLRKLKAGDFDAIILAFAGLHRANLIDHSIMTNLPHEEFLPAAGQGALALQCRRDDTRTQQLLLALNDPNTHHAITLEREVVKLLNGNCQSPIAALATIEGTNIHLQAAVASQNGHPPVLRANASTDKNHAHDLPTQVVANLRQQGYAG